MTDSSHNNSLADLLSSLIERKLIFEFSGGLLLVSPTRTGGRNDLKQYELWVIDPDLLRMILNDDGTVNAERPEELSGMWFSKQDTVEALVPDITQQLNQYPKGLPAGMLEEWIRHRTRRGMPVGAETHR